MAELFAGGFPIINPFFRYDGSNGSNTGFKEQKKKNKYSLPDWTPRAIRSDALTVISNRSFILFAFLQLPGDAFKIRQEIPHRNNSNDFSCCFSDCQMPDLSIGHQVSGIMG